MRVSEGRVSDFDWHPPTQILGKGFRTKIKKPLSGTLRRRATEIDTGGSLEAGIELGRRRAMRLVNSHFSEPAEQLGATVSWSVGSQQIRPVLDERRRHIAGNEVRVL